MSRKELHRLDAASAQKRIAAAKSNKRFVSALLDRDHREHKEAVEHWTRLHEAAFFKSDSVASARLNERRGDALQKYPAAVAAVSEHADTIGNPPRIRERGVRTKSRLQDGGGPVQEQTSVPNSSGPPVINEASHRIQAILDNVQARFEIRENPDADRTYADSYADHDAGATAVATYGAIIEREAVRQGVDADLVKAIMYVENAQGSGYGFAETFGLASTILPMNINKNLWSGLGAEPDEFHDPEVNVQMGVTLLGRIWDRVDDPTPEKGRFALEFCRA